MILVVSCESQPVSNLGQMTLLEQWLFEREISAKKRLEVSLLEHPDFPRMLDKWLSENKDSEGYPEVSSLSGFADPKSYVESLFKLLNGDESSKTARDYSIPNEWAMAQASRPLLEDISIVLKERGEQGAKQEWEKNIAKLVDLFLQHPDIKKSYSK